MGGQKEKTKKTSWDELSSHQAEADSLNLASSWLYYFYFNQAIWKMFDFYHLHQIFLRVPEGVGVKM